MKGLRILGLAFPLLCAATGCGSNTQPPATNVDGSSGASADAATGPTLRVATFNLLHGFPSFERLQERTQQVVQWLAQAKPDLVAIQEAHQTPLMPNRGAQIAQQSGYHWVWEKAAGVSFVFEEGPGILSRTPIAESFAATLPHPGMGGAEVRKVVGIKTTTPVGPVVMFSAHLTNQENSEVRADQAAAAHDFVVDKAGATPHILGGDMNDIPDSLTNTFLRGDASHAGRTGTLVDAWRTANPSQPGPTSSPPSPSLRIDYVYVSRAFEVLGCQLVFDQPVNGLYASDHLGVMCDVRLLAR